MRPTRLSLRNIRAFNALDINFADINACTLVGQNGAGKTTITEGILRALYSDGPTILPGSMVRLGADDAAIELQYIHNGHTYRIIRTGGKRSDLQFMMSDGNGGWLPLSGATSKETQAKIDASLSMDEDLFLNSCYVGQGDSAGICTARPAERKALMYRIYKTELSRFEALHNAAKNHVAGLDSSLAAGRSKRTDLEARIADRAAIAESKKQAEAELEALRGQLQQAECELNRLREDAARQRAEHEKLGALDKQISGIRQECSGLKGRIEGRQTQIDSCEKLLSQGDAIRAQCERANQLEAECEKLSKQAEDYSRLGQEYLQAKSAMETELRQIQDTRGAEIVELERKSSDLDTQRIHIQNSIDACSRAIADYEHRAALIAEVPCNGGPMAETCKLLADARAAKDRLTAERERKEQLENEVADRWQQRDEVEADLSSRRADMGAELDRARTRLQADVDAVLEQKTALGYDKAAHTAVLSAYNAAKQARETLTAIASAESKVQTEQAALEQDEQDLNAKREHLQSLEAESRELAAKVQPIDQISISMKDRLVNTIRAEMETQTRNVASADTLLDQIAKAEEELQYLDRTLSDSEHERTLWATLQDAYSRDGIPALIIDAAIPAIEEYANDLLTRLSDGRMSLKFVTQKATRTAGIAETLDIFVSDGAGERAYEDFSGGEQLRVSLAVRIAIGQILAQRSGATIRTLILDEVCSPLDQAGEDALVECIARLQRMFDCILLITHRDSLKDRLPQQIEVIKGANGSEVRVA